jgi:hypothetical protein
MKLFNNLFTSLNIARTVKSRRMRWAGHVTHMKEITVYNILIRKWENLGIDGKIR